MSKAQGLARRSDSSFTSGTAQTHAGTAHVEEEVIVTNPKTLLRAFTAGVRSSL